MCDVVTTFEQDAEFEKARARFDGRGAASEGGSSEPAYRVVGAPARATDARGRRLDSGPARENVSNRSNEAGLKLGQQLAIMPNGQASPPEVTMDEPTQRRYESRARVFKALGHPTRLFMADELARGERCVCELTALVGADISTVSKHLAILRGVGIVGQEKRGNQVFYSLRLPCIVGFFECVETVIREQAKRQMAAIC